MFKKARLCVIAGLMLAPLAAAASEARDYAGPQPTPGWRSAYPARRHASPHVIRGYYPRSFGVHHYAVRAYRPHPYRSAFYGGYPAAALVPNGAAVLPETGFDRPPIVAYTSATAFVPVTTYAPVPVRVYYLPQQQPYYNVPPYLGPAACFCD